jgi:hypothetical protein
LVDPTLYVNCLAFSSAPQVFTAVTYWRLAPDPILANQLLNCVETSEIFVLRQMQLLKIQVFRGIFLWRS